MGQGFQTVSATINTGMQQAESAPVPQTPHLSHEASTAKYAYLNIGDLAAGLSPTRASSNASIHSSSTLQQPNLLTCHPSATSCAQDNVPLVASAPALHDQLGSRQDSGVVPHSSDVNSMPSDVRKLIAQIAEMQVASNSAGNDSRLPAPQDAPTFTNIQNSASPASSGIPTHHLGFEGCVHLPSHGTEASSAHHLLRTPPTPPNSAHVTRSVDTLSLKLQLEQLRQLQQQQQEIQQQTEVLRCAALNAMSMLAVPHPASGSATAAAAEVPLNYVPVTPGTGAAGISPLAWGMLADQQRLQQLQQQLVQQQQLAAAAQQLGWPLAPGFSSPAGADADSASSGLAGSWDSAARWPGSTGSTSSTSSLDSIADSAASLASGSSWASAQGSYAMQQLLAAALLPGSALQLTTGFKSGRSTDVSSQAGWLPRQHRAGPGKAKKAFKAGGDVSKAGATDQDGGDMDARHAPGPPSSKLFVGNISCQVTEAHVQQLFAGCGKVTSVKIMYNSRKMHRAKDQWRSREYGFVDYATQEEAEAAIARHNGTHLPGLTKEGCTMIVQYAKSTPCV